MAHGTDTVAGDDKAQGETAVGRLPAGMIEELCDELLARGGRVWRRVASDSMAPLLQVGDRILVEPCDAQRIRPGDIIVFRSAAGPMVHRVLGAHHRGVKTLLVEKGDANSFAGTVEARRVVGRVCRRDRDGQVVNLLRGRGRMVQVILTTFSWAELAAHAAGRGLRRALGIRRSSGLAGGASRLLGRASARIIRLLGGG